MTSGAATQPSSNQETRPDRATQWRAARRLYPFYAQLNSAYKAGIPPCPELESPADHPQPEVFARVERWFTQVDERIEVHQLRELLQTSDLGTQETLSALAQRYFEKQSKNDSDRDKLDFVLVQYFSHSVPSDWHKREVKFEEVAQMLGPVLPSVAKIGKLQAPGWLEPLERVLNDLRGCSTLGKMLGQDLLAKAHQIKVSAGERYYQPAAVVTFARFNFFARKIFFGLVHADLQAVRRVLRQLEQQGISTVDCSPAQLSSQEPIARLRQICDDWKKPFRAAYTRGHSFKVLVGVREAVEAAVAKVPGAKDQEAGSVSHIEPAPAHDLAAESAGSGDTTLAKNAGLEQCLEKIASQLIAATPAANSMATVSVDSSKVLLASWEVAAFVSGDEVSSALQRIVSARALLVQAMDRCRHAGDRHGLKTALDVAHTEAALMQEKIAQVKEANNIDAAVNLAASSKRLLSLMKEAEQLAGA